MKIFEHQAVIRIGNRSFSVPLARRKGDGRSWIGYCPFCPDKSGHLELDFSFLVFRCHRCHQGGVFKCSKSKEFTQTKVVVQDERKEWEEVNVDSFELDTDGLKFLLDRGLSDKAIRDLKPVTVSAGWVSIPHYARTGSFLGFIHRNLDKQAKTRYLYSEDFVRVPWGLHRFDGEQVVLVEGAFDAAGDCRALAMLGSDLSVEALDLVVGLPVSSFVVALDSDITPQSVKIAYKLANRRKTCDVRIAALPEGKDPDDIGIDECVRLSKPWFYQACA